MDVLQGFHKKNILPYDLKNLADSQEYVILIALKLMLLMTWVFCKSQLML